MGCINPTGRRSVHLSQSYPYSLRNYPGSSNLYKSAPKNNNVNYYYNNINNYHMPMPNNQDLLRDTIKDKNSYIDVKKIESKNTFGSSSGTNEKDLYNYKDKDLEVEYHFGNFAPLLEDTYQAGNYQPNMQSYTQNNAFQLPPIDKSFYPKTSRNANKMDLDAYRKLIFN